MSVEFEFAGELWFWRGPAPWHFVTVPEEWCVALADVAELVSYGWGMIPVTVTIGSSTWATALWPKDGSYLVPIKAAVREARGLELGDRPVVQVAVRLPL